MARLDAADARQQRPVELQPGVVSARRSAARMYASSMTPGMPCWPSREAALQRGQVVLELGRVVGVRERDADSSSASGGDRRRPASRGQGEGAQDVTGAGRTASMSDLPDRATQSTGFIPCRSVGTSIAPTAADAKPH
ncbi:hypothetical protein K7G98_10130 [Saccharothrix sp. MB29]|nr:hypothetical protein [Saccharothrix sp. MB29]